MLIRQFEYDRFYSLPAILLVDLQLLALLTPPLVAEVRWPVPQHVMATDAVG